MQESEIKAQMERLEAVRKDAGLIATIPRVVAAEFGVVPLRLEGDVLEVASIPGVSPRVIEALSRALEKRVEPVPFEEALVHLYVTQLYVQKRALNFNTFTEDDFLERPDCLKKLLEEKESEPVKPHLRPDPARLALLDYAYRSVLENLDSRAPAAGFQAGGTELAFEVAGEGEAAVTRIFRREDLPGSVLVLARESYSYAGIEHAHGWRSHEVRAFPFYIHPTELQLTGIEADGTLHLYVYDHVEKVRPGETPRYEVCYQFLSMGTRLRRTLRLKVYGIWHVPRDKIERTVDPIRWTPFHLQRWLGFDLAAGESGGKPARTEDAA